MNTTRTKSTLKEALEAYKELNEWNVINFYWAPVYKLKIELTCH